jgi:hypothetical protein
MLSFNISRGARTVESCAGATLSILILLFPGRISGRLDYIVTSVPVQGRMGVELKEKVGSID